MSRSIVAILLAAGSGSRFGSDKLMHPLPDGTPIAVQSARNLKAALPHSRRIAVIRPGSGALADALAAEAFEVVVCDNAADGMGHSLAAGVDAAGRDGKRESADDAGFVVALADMPFITPSSIVAVGDSIVGGASLAAPTFEGRRGHPVGFSAIHRAALLGLTGDEGARRLISSAGALMTLVAVDDPGVLRDIDTPEDLRLATLAEGATQTTRPASS
ncbi:nucleotidyltransferase family protein [soil metagenome]